MTELSRRFLDLPPDLLNFPPSPRQVSHAVATAVRGVLGRLASEVAKVEASRGPDGRWSAVIRLGRRLIDDGQGGITEPADLVIAAFREGRLAELLDAGPVEISDAGPTVTMSVTVSGHLAEAVRDAILVAAPDAEVGSPHRSARRTLTITTSSAPKKSDRLSTARLLNPEQPADS